MELERALVKVVDELYDQFSPLYLDLMRNKPESWFLSMPKFLINHFNVGRLRQSKEYSSSFDEKLRMEIKAQKYRGLSIIPSKELEISIFYSNHFIHSSTESFIKTRKLNDTKKLIDKTMDLSYLDLDPEKLIPGYVSEKKSMFDALCDNLLKDQ